MKFLTSLTVGLSGAAVASAVVLPAPLAERDANSAGVSVWEKKAFIRNVLEKRKGGGGRSGGFSSSSSGSSGKSGSSSSGSSSSRPAPNTLGKSNVGGTSSGGSGVPRTFGKGKYYGGGAATPFRAGARSRSGLVPIFIPLVLLSAAFPGLWLYGAYSYDHRVTYFNQSGNNGQGINETRDLSCLCQQYQECGCDDNDDDDYVKEIVGDGNYNTLNKSLLTVGQLKGSTRLLINGTLPNGTTADDGSWATGNHRALLEHASWSIVAAGLFYSVLVM